MTSNKADQPAASLATAPDLDSSSSDDEDFNPDANPSAPNEEGLSSDGDSEFSSNEATSRKSKGRKRKQSGEGELELEFASGDEATIQRGKRRKQKKAKGAPAADSDEDNDDQGEGGLIKTRAQRAREQKEKKPLASAANATVDVDALWASMNTRVSSKPTTTQPTAADQSHRERTTANGTSAEVSDAGAAADRQSGSEPLPSTAAAALDETITIQRIYTFAGQTTTESQVVPKSSASALLYLQQKSQPPSPPAATSSTPPLRRPKKRTSLFDPGASSAAKTPSAAPSVGPKLNTIEKSKLDWAGFVDKEGLKDDLDVHSRAKEGYLGRMDFLGRVEAKREDEGRRARGL